MRHETLRAALVAGTFCSLTAASFSAGAATIQVGPNCSIAEAIQAAETDAVVGGCSAGNQADEVLIPDGTDESFTTLTNITTDLTLRAQSGRAILRGDTSGGYFTLFNVTGNLTIEDLTLRDGVSDGIAGCVITRNVGTFTARRTVFDNCSMSPTNTANTPAGTIYNIGTTALDSCLVINSSTIATEAAIRQTGGTLTLTNTTVTASSAAGVRVWNGTLDLIHSTIAGNGGFDVRIRTGRIGNAYNSIAQTLEGGFTALEGSVISADPLLGPLQDNGGPTQTMAPLQGSPVLDAANDTYCEALDQRGQSRPSGDHCDVGAVEHQVMCDNGFLHPSEDCDGTQFQPQFQSCPQGYEGTPTCDATCTINGVPNGCTAIVDAGVGGSGGAGGAGGSAGSAGATTGGSAGGPTDAGTAGSPTYEGDGSVADAGVRTKKPDSDDCGCRLPGNPAPPSGTPQQLIWGLAGLWVLRRRRWVDRSARR